VLGRARAFQSNTTAGSGIEDQLALETLIGEYGCSRRTLVLGNESMCDGVRELELK